MRPLLVLAVHVTTIAALSAGCGAHPSTVPAPSPAAAPEVVVVATVDLPRTLTATGEGGRVDAIVERFAEQRRWELEARLRSLAAAEPDPADPARSELALHAQRQAASTELSQVEQDAAKKREELLSPVQARVRSLVQQIGRERGYGLVLTGEAAPYHDGPDITDEVVRRYAKGE